jgi:hypothetical protein
VEYLLKARKFIHRLVKDTTRDPNADILEVVYAVRRVDQPIEDIKLKLSARPPKPVMRTAFRLRPSAALNWHGERIRGIDHKIVHSKIENGLEVGRVRGWHEHQWTAADGDSYVIDANSFMRNVQEDFRSLLRFCMVRWRIEVKDSDNQQLLKW